MNLNSTRLLLNEYDWSQDPTEVYEFLTAVFQSRNYTETRVARRLEPRRTLTFQSTDVGDDFRKNLAQLTARGQNLFLRLSGEELSLATETLIDDVSIDIDTPTIPVRKGEILSIAGTLVLVDTVTGDALSLSEEIGAVLPIGTPIYRTDQFFFDTNITFSALSDSISRQTLTLALLPGKSPPPPPGAATTEYLGREVFAHKNDWRSAVQYQLTPVFEKVDFQFGTLGHRSVLTYTPYTVRELHTFETEQAKTEMLEFFLRQKGRRGEFWKPSPVDDFTLAATPTSGDVSLTVRGEFLEDYAESPNRRHVFVEMSNGTLHMAEITAVVQAGDTAFLTLAAPWETTLETASIRRAGFLDLCRFGTDVLTFTARSNTVFETTLAFFSLRQDGDS